MGTEPVNYKPLIYSIDDDVSMNKLMHARFTKYGCEIKTFVDHNELLEEIRKRRPKLLILDLNLGEGGTGFDIIETVRNVLKLDFPIIVVSSESDSVKVAHALEIGASDFVVKPPFRFQFEEKVAEYIRTADIPEHAQSAIKEIEPGLQNVKLDFQMSIQEVTPMGFTLLSTHLIRKGSAFWLSGDIIKKIFPTLERIFVTVLGSATQMTTEQRLYQIRVEVDPTQEQTIRDIKSFLNTARMENS